jgi:hypothetical protein
MIQALLAHPQEALNKRYLVYCVRVMSVAAPGCVLYQVPFVESLLRMSKLCSKHVKTLNS